MTLRLVQPVWGRFTDEKRSQLLILNGMLLQVGVKMLEPGPKPKRNKDGTKKPKTGFSVHAFPDLSVYSSLQEFEPGYNKAELSDYIHRFADTVIPLMKMEPESVDYIRENLGRVADFLGEKLNNGHLRFFKRRYSEIGPEDGGAILFLDVSDPAQVVFHFPVFGLKKVTATIGYIPWRPCENESQDPEPTLIMEEDD